MKNDATFHYVFDEGALWKNPNYEGKEKMSRLKENLIILREHSIDANITLSKENFAQAAGHMKIATFPGKYPLSPWLVRLK